MNNKLNFTVIKSIEDERTFVADEGQFATMRVHDTYSEYGRPINAYEAEDYSPANSGSTFMDDLRAHLQEHFAGKDFSELAYVGSDNDHFTATDFELPAADLTPEEAHEIETYCAGHVQFAEYEHAMNFWDGHNYRTIRYDDGPWGAPFQTLPDAEQAPILEAFRKAIPFNEKDWQPVGTNLYGITIDGLTFTCPQHGNYWYLAEVAHEE